MSVSRVTTLFTSFRQELGDRIDWLVSLRWIAAGATLLIIAISHLRLRRQADRQIPTLDERPAPCTPIPTLPSISPNVSRNVSRNVGPNVWRWPA